MTSYVSHMISPDFQLVPLLSHAFHMFPIISNVFLLVSYGPPWVS